MATKLYALSEENVSHVKDILAPDIIESPVLDNMAVFNKLRIKVIEDIEYAQTQSFSVVRVVKPAVTRKVLR